MHLRQGLASSNHSVLSNKTSHFSQIGILTRKYPKINSSGNTKTSVTEILALLEV